ncbi:hypothetical protein AYO21_10696 [Fonsecaea monophora]|uniref:Glycolipid transfer protein domain-containing protein n=1 Tax=Fonsecaea monophora TaxID=254056 RepID=A0A177EW02_9EURO|nr:hypothetical protein AYO21_10696 [Fonsecaea monophora]KAH0835271.1 Glycolipid transfer protein [Fonsecaea pedrosoi]OAG35129.1 hypothetical protein AYO21_10696 [Fonsecaea monophora]
MIATDIPSGQTWFSLAKTQFTDVSVAADQQVSTQEFLDASECMTSIFDLMGSSLFKPMKQDLVFNIGRVRKRYQETPEASSTVQALVAAELALTSPHPACDGLIWLVRGLDFLSQALLTDLENLEEENCSKELADAFKTSYDMTLGPYHNTFIRLIFKAAMGATPKRKDFYRRLSGEGVNIEITQDKLNQYLDAQRKVVTILKEFLTSDAASGKWAKAKV